MLQAVANDVIEALRAIGKDDLVCWVRPRGVVATAWMKRWDATKSPETIKKLLMTVE